MKCYDCNKRVWPWQRKGMDFRSHSGCYRARLMKLLAEGSQEMVKLVRDEIRRAPKEFFK